MVALDLALEAGSIDEPSLRPKPSSTPLERLGCARASIHRKNGTTGASTIAGKYNASDAKWVPTQYRQVVLQIAVDATNPPFETYSGSVMVGFDVDLMKAVSRTLGMRSTEVNVIGSNIGAGVSSGLYQMGITSVFTNPIVPIYQVEYPDFYQGMIQYAAVTVIGTPVGKAMGRAIAAALKSLIQGGTYRSIASKWGLGGHLFSVKEISLIS